MSDIYLHIGGYKTGSTALQGFFRWQKRIPCGQVLYPQSILWPFQNPCLRPSVTNTLAIPAQSNGHLALAISARNEASDDPKEYSPPLKDLFRELEAEISEKLPDKVVLSSEVFLPSMSLEVDSIDPNLLRASNLLKTAKIVLYVRDPLDFALSKYKQVVKSQVWAYTSDFEAFCQEWWPCANYAAMSRPWIDAFGADNFIVRPYPGRTEGWNIFDDFLETIGCDARIDAGMTAAQQLNVSPSLYATEVLRWRRLKGALFATQVDAQEFLEDVDRTVSPEEKNAFGKAFRESHASSFALLELRLRSDLEDFTRIHNLPGSTFFSVL